MVLCDTNIFIHAFNGRQDTIDKMDEIGFDEIVISSISVMELYQGMSNKSELDRTKKKIKFYSVVEIDSQTSKLATDLVQKFNLSHNLQIPDALLGATSIVNQIPFFTYNTKDFVFMPGIILLTH